jgi:hypothetical protein
MQRDLYIHVTQIPVLIPCGQKERDGVANFLSPRIHPDPPLRVIPSPVRALRAEELDKNTERGRQLWRALSSADQQRLLGLIGLRQALEAADGLSVEKLERAYLKVMPDLQVTLPGTSESVKEIIYEASARTYAQRGVSPGMLALLLTRALKRARLVLWWHQKRRRFLPAIYCTDVATALYVRALLGVAGGGALLVCPHCGTPFIQQRSDQDYCSIRCREAHRVARWRAAKGKKGSAKKRQKRSVK